MTISALVLGLVTAGCVQRPPPQGGGLDALTVLAGIPVLNEVQAGYNRDLFGYPADADHDHCDTRAEVLIRDSTASVTPAFGCPITSGQWLSAYDGVRTTTSAADIEIDHIVALKEAWDSGAYAWDDARRVAYGNDLTDHRTLAAVTGTTNQSKGDRDPSNWLPPAAADLCTYLGDWVAVKARWGMAMDQSEHGRIRNLLEASCPGWTIAPYTPAPASLQP